MNIWSKPLLKRGSAPAHHLQSASYFNVSVQAAYRASPFVWLACLSACSSILPDRPLSESPVQSEPTVKIEITCSIRNAWPPESKRFVVTAPDKIAQIRTGIEAVADNWLSWGPTTRPAGEVHVAFFYDSGTVSGISAAKDFSVIWNAKGWRRTNEAERAILLKAVPNC